ncbi:MAG: glycoside hydrolase family 15 protein, partial [Chloroflexi bacterium]
VETLSALPLHEMNGTTGAGEEDARYNLIRIVECTRGELPVTMTLKASPLYGATPSTAYLVSEHTGAVISGGEQHLGLAIMGTHRVASFKLTVEQDAGGMNPTLIAQATLQKGERLLFTIGTASTVQAAQMLAECVSCEAECEAALTHTLVCWRMWAAQSSYHGPYTEWVQRSALVLKMLTYAPTGAIVAAPTTSLPEEIGGVRNWDYRYTWLRDATFTLYALSVLGYTEESRAFTCWLRNLSYTSGEDLQIMYGIRGERDLEERELSHLDGYCSSRPVRIGNGASHQKQLDVFGEVLDYIH